LILCRKGYPGFIDQGSFIRKVTEGIRIMKTGNSLKIVSVSTCIFLLLLCVFGEKSHAIEEAVVKILTVSNKPDYDQPWQMVGQRSGSGSGYVISGQRIITNAHVVANQTFIQVQRVGDPEKYVAKVKAIGHECDLAILTVEDPNFFKRISPLSIGQLPNPRDTVAVYGFPIGGDKLSITEGVVSRIEMNLYSHSRTKLLKVQIDAPINPGNSGGPVVKDGKVVGIAYEGMFLGDNVGYMIPPLIITHFLEDVKDGTYDGFPCLGIATQKLENSSYREFLGMNKGQSGVVVNRVVYGSSSWGILREGDVILAVDGTRIANDGTVPFGQRDRLNCSYHIIQKHIGETVKITILRQKQVKEVTIPLQGKVDVIPRYEYDAKPTYYIFGGLVFINLTNNYLNPWKSRKYAPAFLVDHFLSGLRTSEREDIVLLKCVLADHVNFGYHDYRNEVVEKLNGSLISGMRELAEIIDNASGPYLEIELENKKKVVLDVELCRNASPDILDRYRISSDRSDNLKDFGEQG